MGRLSVTAFLGSDHHLEKAQQLKFANVKVVRLVTSGPLFAALATEIKYNKSTIMVTVSATVHQISLDALKGVSDYHLSCDLYLYRFLVPHPYPFNQIVFKAEVDWHD